MRIGTFSFAMVAAVVAASHAHAQERFAGAGWAAYYGCWAPGDPASVVIDAPAVSVQGALVSPAPMASASSAATLRCVLPGSTDDRVTMLTVLNGAVIDRQEVVADGSDHAVDRAGCVGSERATWTGGGARLVITGELRCSGGAAAVTTTLLDVTSPSSWVQISSIRSGRNVEARPQWYRRVAPDTSWTGVQSALANTDKAGEIARVAALSDPDAREVVRLATTADDALVRAWLVSRAAAGRRTLPVTGAVLLGLADAGVSGTITDVLVALAHPDEFDLVDGDVRAAAAPVAGGGTNGGRMRRSGYSWLNDPICGAGAGAFAWGIYDPMFGGFYPGPAFGNCGAYGFNSLGGGWGSGLAYGYPYGSPFLGYGGGFGGGGWFWRPVGNITPFPRVDTRATLTRGGGYSPAGGSAGSGRTASGTSGGSTANATGRSGGSTSAPAPASGSSGGRTAVRKP